MPFEAQASSVNLPYQSRAWGGLPLLRGFALMVGTLIGLFVCYFLVHPFLAALAWALTFSVLTAPLHRRLERKVRRPNLAAAISVILIALIVILPATLLGQQLLMELSAGFATVKDLLSNGHLQRRWHSYPALAYITAVIERSLDVREIVANATSSLTNLGGAFVRESLSHLITAVLTFYLLFYFLRDRRAARRQIKIYSPLTNIETDNLIGRASDTIHAVIFGTVVAAMAQGALGSLIFWLLGLPNPLFWGAVMSLLAIVPLLGAFIVWVPAAVYLALSGEWGKAAILVGWGAVVIGGIDNLLHPILAGGRMRLHTVPTFFSIVGGIILFGAAGLIIGPLVVTLTLTLLEIWRERTRQGVSML
jgi:predicted PurR-regulated permease PerM